MPPRSAAGPVRAAILAAALLAGIALLLVAIFARTTAAPPVTFVSLQGERLATPALKGRVVIVNFWATDCPVCVREMPDLARTYERFRGRGVELVAVAMRHDPPNYVIRFAERNRLPFKVALDPLGEHAQAFGNVRLTPTTFVIDKRGDIAMKITGAIDFARLNALIEEKLKES